MIKFDCRFFEGERPCKYKLLCSNCSKYSKIGEKILIIKMAAMGDVLRTTPILKAIKRKYPNSHISWICEKNSFKLLQTNPLIDSLFIYNLSSVLQITTEEYDYVFSFDKMKYSASIATLAKSRKKFGFGLNKFGNIFSFNKSSEYSLLLGIDNELKFRKNKMTYQEIIYQMAELPYKKDEYILNLTEEDRKISYNFCKKNKISENDFIIGFNIGSGEDFANKSLTTGKFIQLAKKIISSFNCKIILLGDEKEREKQEEIKKEVRSKNIILLNNCRVREFAGVIERCNIIVSGDTLGMHIGIALKKKVVAIFTSTAPVEIELYGRGIKIIPPINCTPCYKRYCDKKPSCIDAIKIEDLYRTILKLKNK